MILHRQLLILVLIFGSVACTSDKNNQKGVEIDAVKVSPNIFNLLFENEHTRVIQYTLEPGERDNWHTHPPKTSYVLSGGKLKIVLENGEELIVEEEKGKVSWMNYVGKHYAENIGKTTVSILLTEFNSVD